MNRSNQKPKNETTVYVAMSGGVDSSVVAALMKEQGYKTVGVTMCFSITHPNNKKPSCCGVDGIEDAKRAAQILEIPHYVMDFAQDINDHIIDDFTNEYLSGRTPNPCVRCNQHLKFGSLYAKVMSLGADYLATGHYGKIHYNPDTNLYELKKAEDLKKDQSYFLYSMKKETLERVLFPLGDLTKQEVRDLANKYQLNTANKPESQDICFVPDEGYQKFLEDRVGKETFSPGPFKDKGGNVIGKHKGIAYYTIGQREGLGIALGRKVYVTHIDRQTNTITIGNLEDLYSHGLIASQLNLVSMNMPDHPVDVEVRIRHNSTQVPATLTILEDSKFRVDFKEPQKSVTPGQSVVAYHNDVVLAGGIIEDPLKGDHVAR